jgi:hypothetical protein
MRIAAGIVLIIAAIINIVAALGYLGGGALSSAGGGSALSKALAEESRKSGTQLTAEQNAAMAKLQQATENGPSGTALMGFGVFLVVTVVTSIAGAVCLFRGKAAKFIIVAALLAAGAEIGGILITRFGAANVAGLLGAALALISVRSIMAKAEAVAPVRA